MSMKRAIYADYRRYRATGTRSWGAVVFFMQGFWAACIYRVAHYVYKNVRVPIVRPLLTRLLAVAYKFIEIVTSISIPPDCEIGEGLYIGHFGPIILNSGVRIGRNCNLSQGITLGLAGRGEKRGCPTLGDRVYVGTNAIIIGKITVGDD